MDRYKVCALLACTRAITSPQLGAEMEKLGDDDLEQKAVIDSHTVMDKQVTTRIRNTEDQQRMLPPEPRRADPHYLDIEIIHSGSTSVQY